MFKYEYLTLYYWYIILYIYIIWWVSLRNYTLYWLALPIYYIPIEIPSQKLHSSPQLLTGVVLSIEYYIYLSREREERRKKKDER